MYNIYTSIKQWDHLPLPTGLVSCTRPCAFTMNTARGSCTPNTPALLLSSVATSPRACVLVCVCACV